MERLISALQTQGAEQDACSWRQLAQVWSQGGKRPAVNTLLVTAPGFKRGRAREGEGPGNAIPARGAPAMSSQEPPEGSPSPHFLGSLASLPSSMAAREGPPAASGDADAVAVGPSWAG
uniref:Uncharacterized protein n=1 Tax=Rangifer tarandus platyrhynchus TaxID=3082113 RepID=A0ACB0EIH9_RANTA|nr:unnamed protein product [Rangifer tarandus platyrhynchus]